MDFKPTDTSVILYRLDDIEKNISILREFLTKYPDLSFYKIAKKIFEENNNNDIFQESLYLVVTLEKILDKIKKYEELKDIF